MFFRGCKNGLPASGSGISLVRPSLCRTSSEYCLSLRIVSSEFGANLELTRHYSSFVRCRLCTPAPRPLGQSPQLGGPPPKTTHVIAQTHRYIIGIIQGKSRKVVPRDCSDQVLSMAIFKRD
jgi:hypothetical protein